MAAELTEHLGYEKGQASGQARSNTRNGTTKKTVMSEVGAFEIEVPRDRAGSFTRAWCVKDSGALMVWIR